MKSYVDQFEPVDPVAELLRRHVWLAAYVAKLGCLTTRGELDPDCRARAAAAGQHAVEDYIAFVEGEVQR